MVSSSPDLTLFNQQLKEFEKLSTTDRFKIDKDDLYPCLADNTPNTGFDAHYIYHPAWAARVVKAINPQVHVDISSTLHFCSIISAFIKTDFYDYRPAILNLNNLACKHADLTKLTFQSNSISSLSCMHTIEHIGLGRYGDPIDPEGDISAFNELKRVCAINGNLLIVVPVGVKKIRFNAHRIYNPHDIITYMSGFDIVDFSFVNDQGSFIENGSLNDAANQTYGCGCFWFKKIS